MALDFDGADDNEPILAGFDYFEGTFLRHNDYVRDDPYVDYAWSTLDGAGNSGRWRRRRP